MNGQQDRTRAVEVNTTNVDAPTIPNLPKRVPQKPGRHRAPEGASSHRARAGTPGSVATWAGGRHYRPEATR